MYFQSFNMFVGFIRVLVLCSQYALAGKELFFPYGSLQGDTMLTRKDESTTNPIPIGEGGFNFYGSQRNNLIINGNGAIAFSTSTLLPRIEIVPQPIQDLGALITPYWADTNGALNDESVWYRMVTRGSGSDDDFDLPDAVVKMSFTELQDYQSSWMLIVTFEDLAFFNPPQPSSSDIFDLRNSYQVVLLTDGDLSFCIFNYGELTWTTSWVQDMQTVGDDIGGDGLGGNYPAQAGFTDGINSYLLEGSGTPDIININRMSNIGVPGRFIFQVNNDVITEAVIPTSELFFPYGLGVGDTSILNQNDFDTPHISTGTGFRFYGSKRGSLQVSNNGVIFFGGSSPAIGNDTDPFDGSIPFIAPYWADADTTADRGTVYYRNISRESSGDDGAFEIADAVVKMAYGELQNFKSSWMFLATWNEVSYYQDPMDSQYNHLRNSFQVVLLTDGSISFSIFNYGDITWTTGAQQGGNSSGLGGTEAQVGFSAGDEMRSYFLKGSQTPDIVNINERSNTGVPGRFIFKINEATITQPQCKSFGKVSIHPSVGSMLGGTEVLIGGACFNSTSVIKCRFDDKEVPGRMISSMDALCVTPTFYKTGRISLNVSINNGSTFDFSAVFTLENIEDTTPGVTTIATTSKSALDTFAIEWGTNLLMDVEAVDVVLYGYREDTGNNLVVLENLLTLGENISYQTGSTNVTLSSTNTNITNEVGLFAVLQHQDVPTPNNGLDGRAGLWSEVHVLQWLRDLEATSWCTQWLSENEKENEFIDTAPSCPCTITLAMLDFARFRRDPSCYQGSSRTDNCQQRPGAIHCVRSVQPSVESGGQECCYAIDGNISNAYIPQAGGGFAHRYHHNGIRPYANPTQVPFLSHFIADTLPWTYCCQLPGGSTEQSQTCSEYTLRRPSQMCNGYEPPHLGLGNGDPHITTLDMKRYTFNGHGEFTLLKTVDESFFIQTRTAPYQDVNATIFVAVAAQCNDSDVIHVEVNDDRIMDAYVRLQAGGDFERIDFEQASSWNYEGVSVSGFNISATGILVAFEGGAGIHLKAADDALLIQVVPHSSFRGRTRGLMGTWNNDVSDDYMTPDGIVLSPNLTTEEIYFQFGLKWNISEESSILYYPVGVTQDSVSDLSYIPMFETTVNPAVDQSQVESTCRDDGFCTFDFQTTGSASFAQNTAASFQAFQDAVDSTNIVLCPTLGTPDSGNTIVSRYTVGGEANYTCSSGYQLSDDVDATCQSDGTWTNEIIPECIDIIKPRITCPRTSSNTTVLGRAFGMVSWMEPTIEENSDIFNVSLVEPPSNRGEFPIGISNVTYVVTDGAGLTDTCTFIVNVTDDEDPTIQCPDPIIVPTAPSMNSAVVTWPLLNASDNSGNVEIMSVGESRNGTNFTIGAVVLSYLARDSSGNTDQCSFWVNVTDMEAPIITCPAIPTVPTEEGQSYAIVTWNEPSIVNGTVSDNSGFATPVFQGNGSSNGGNFELGTNVLSYRVIDQAGNSNNCSFTITVIDTEKPRITCQNMTSTTTVYGQSFGYISWEEPIIEDNSGLIFEVVINSPSYNGGQFPIGISNISYLATDAEGLYDSCTITANVIDDEFPTIQCPDPTIVPTTPSMNSAVVTWPLLNASDNSGYVEIMPVGESRNGTNFTIGAVVLSYIVRDSSGNTNNCSFLVNVADVEVPIITCPAIPTVPTEEGQSYAIVTWNEPSIVNGTVSDNSGFATPVFLGNVSSNGGNFELGTNILSYRVIDQAGNINNCSFTITVIDDENPRITCPRTSSNTTIPGRSVGMVSWMEPTIEENSGIFNVSLVEPASNGEEFPIGISNITYIVTDGVGLMDSCTFSIVVIDNEDPVIQCPESIHVTTRPDLPTALVSWIDPTESDNSGHVVVDQVGSYINGGEFFIRISTITYVATDESGNSNNCSFYVNVTDIQDPVIRNCPSPITTVSRPGLNLTEVSWTPPTATDNSGPVEPIFLGAGSLGGNYSIGTVTATYMVQDLSGNMDVCTFSITVRDYADVMVICPENIVEATTPGEASAVVTWAEATVPIGWNNVTVTLEGMTNGGEFPIGETSLTYNALDPDGLNDSCTFYVVVIDEERPNITCPSPIEVPTETNLPNATVSWIEPEATDNSGDVTVTLIGPGSNGGSFSIGETIVSYRAVDDAGNPSLCIVTVRVVDDEAPDLTCPDPILSTTEHGSARSGSVMWNKPTATDNSGMVTVSQIGTEQNGGTFNIGVTNISYQAIDESGNIVSCVFSVFVEDDEPPSQECPSSRSLFTEAGSDSSSVSWTEPSASDNSGAVTTSLVGPGSNGGRFIIGATNVTYRAVDDAGNTDTCYFTITIEDNEAPVVTCPSSISTTTQTGTPRSGPISWDDPTAIDNSGSVTVSITGTHMNGGTFGIGNTNITYQAVDNSGNMHMCSFLIEVEDDEQPVLTCPDPILSTTEPGSARSGSVIWTKPTATDNSGMVTVSQIGTEQNGGTFKIGVTNISYQAIDESGNNVSCVFSVLVEDDEPPSQECPSSRSLFTETGSDSTSVSWTEPSASDNSGAVTTSLVGPGSNGGRFIIGATNVTYRAVDDAGNTDTCYFTIAIEDNEAPVVTCPSSISTTTQTGTPQSGPISWDDPTAIDNSGSVTVSMTGTHMNGGTFGIGNTNITYQAVDNSGNMHMCSFLIEVEDDESPVLTCPNTISATASQETGKATVSWMEPNASDNSGNLTVSLTGPGENGGNFSIGLTNLTYTAIDDAGNMASCVFSISVQDPSSCISDPCLNGGSCMDFFGHFICRCPAGFQGETCQQETVSCESEPAACDAREWCLDSVCQCRPNFIRINGACIPNKRFRVTMTVTNLLGNTLEYIESFADPSSPEFQMIVEDFRGVVLSLTSQINDLVVYQLNQGSVIFIFDGFVNPSLNESAVLSDLQNGISTGSSTDGSLLLVLSPNTVPVISDFDECANTTTNDCSPNAYCTNTAGSYECTCSSSFSDESSEQVGSGRTCVFNRSLLIAIICCAVGVVVFIVVCGALCCWCSRFHYINSMKISRKPDDFVESYLDAHETYSRKDNHRSLDGGGFFHSDSKSTKRNDAPRFSVDNIEETNKGTSQSNRPSRTPRRTSQSNHGFSHSPTRHSMGHIGQFSRPYIVSGSEPTGNRGRSGRRTTSYF